MIFLRPPALPPPAAYFFCRIALRSTPSPDHGIRLIITRQVRRNGCPDQINECETMSVHDCTKLDPLRWLVKFRDHAPMETR